MVSFFFTLLLNIFFHNFHIFLVFICITIVLENSAIVPSVFLNGAAAVAVVVAALVVVVARATVDAAGIVEAYAVAAAAAAIVVVAVVASIASVAVQDYHNRLHIIVDMSP